MSSFEILRGYWMYEQKQLVKTYRNAPKLKT